MSGPVVPNAVPTPLDPIHTAVVQSWHLDQFGHMNVRWYAHHFDDAVWLAWAALGLDQQRLKTEHGCHTVTAASETSFKRECLDGDLFRIGFRLGSIGTKSVAFDLIATTHRTGGIHATCRAVEVFVQPSDHSAIAIPAPVREMLERRLA